MKLSAPADCEAMLNELFNQSIALISTYQIKAGRSPNSHSDCWQVSALSPACAPIYGYSADELIADQALWRSRLHPADWLAHQTANQTAIDRSLQANGSSMTRDYRVHHADGSVRWLRENLTFRHSADGWIATGIAVEITDCKQIEQQQADAIAQLEAQLQSLIAGTAIVTSEDFFSALTQHIAAALDVAFVAVSKLIDRGVPQHYRAPTLETLAFWAQGELHPNLSYPVQNTPCEITIAQGFFCCSANVQAAFPADLDLVEMQAESYLGIALKNAQGHTIGELCLIDTKPIEPSQRTEEILRVFATRAAIELERQRATTALEQLNDALEAKVIDRTQQLQQSEAKLQDVLNGAITTSIFSCFLFADRTWKYDTISIGCEVVFGYTPAEVSADPSLWSARVVPEDMQLLILPAIDRMFTEETTTIEYRFHHLDGSIRWISAVYTARRDDAADCWRVVGVSTDITDRKRLEVDRQQAQLELQAQKDFLQRVINFVPGCIFVKDTQGILQVANLATAELYGTTVEDVLGKRITEFASHLSSAQRRQFEVEDCQVMQTKQPLVKQDCISTVQGQDRWYQVTLKPFVDPQGQVQGVVGNSIDITERKRAELALQQSEERFRQLAESIQDVVWMSTPTSNEVIYISPMFEQIWGYPCDALYASPFLWMETIHPDDRSTLRLAYEQQVLTGYDEQYRIVRPDGEIRWIRDRAFPIRNAAGEIYRIAGIAADITSFKQIESALQHSQQQYQMLVNSIDAIVWQGELHGSEFEFTFVSQQAERILGYPRDRWYEADFWSAHVHPDDFDRAIAYCTSCIEAHLDHVHEYRMQAADGRFVWIEDKTKIIVENNQIQQIIGLFTDISDRKQTELLLEQQQQTMRAIIDHAPLWIWMCDRDRKVQLVNKMLAQDIGVTKAAFLAADDYVDLLGASAQPCIESDAVCWAADTPVRSIETLVLTDGREHTLEVIKTQLKDADGTATHLIGIALDVTDRIAAEAALRHSEETLRLVVQNMPVMLDAYDANGNLIVWNRECERVTGFSAEEITHNPNSLELLYPDPDYRAQMLRQWTQHAGNFRDWEWDITCKDGSRRTILWSNVSQEFPIPGWAGWAIGIDITDRKIAERSLRQSEERYRTLVDNLPGVVYRCKNDQAWTAHYLSDRIFELTGYSASELTASGKRSFGSIIHPDDVEPIWSETQAAIDRDGCYQNQYRIVHANGEVRWVAEYGSGCYAPDGTVLWVDGILFDITDRKRIETALQESEARYRRIVETAGEGIWMIDAEGTTTFVNERMAQMLGLTVAQMVGKSMFDFTDAEGQYIARRNLDRRRQGIGEQHDFKFKRADGSDLWVILETTPIFDAAGIYQGALGMLTDITARKRAEEQLLDLSDRLSLALKSGAIGVWEWDIAADALIWDDRVCELYGVDRSNFTGTFSDWSKRVHPDDWPEAEAATQKALQNEQDYETEFRVVLPDGSIRFIRSSAIVQCNETGESHRMIGINIDVSVQRQAEAKLRQANETLAIANLELARANRLKDEFLANMSHELRTPLSAMLGLSRALQEETFGSLNDRQRQFVETIASSGDHLLALINDILDLAKIGSGRFELELAAVPIYGLCQTSLAFVQPLAEQKNIAIDAHLPPSSCLAVLDERRICQVLINLLSNAVKFTPPGGRVTLSVKVDPQSSIRFSVSDTGIGIAPDDQTLLFQPFVQIDSSLSRHHDGTGLGLALVKQIVELHQGSVSVESQLGKGSCFSVILPDRSLL
ncbi:PAS domain S-box protein [Microcoleus sp. FACHB-1515]|uniref:PAS domain S-box protein n=1 Tax=Cyanophyceae TaxID=3028117 RepID=UPI001686C375|nr:PAS domain S-box protein [Microcoleus sp. FACHB-1515]MBD2089344.1 PAS domain S-box protein [Microcoleus sp. FACHB-1515]